MTSSDGESGAKTRGSRGQRGVKDLQTVCGLRITQREEKISGIKTTPTDYLTVLHVKSIGCGVGCGGVSAQGLMWLLSLLKPSPSSWIIPIIGSLQFFVVVGLKNLFPYWLSLGVSLSSLQFLSSPLHLRSQKCSLKSYASKSSLASPSATRDHEIRIDLPG